VIKGDYWIKPGSIKEVSAGRNYDKNQHDELAHKYLGKKYLEELANYASSLGLDSSKYLDKHFTLREPGLGSWSLITMIKTKLQEDKKKYPTVLSAEKEIMFALGIDRELLGALTDFREAMIYVLKHLKWIALRGVNIELYGLDYEKGQLLLRGLNRIFDREKVFGTGMVFRIFDHKTGRTINVSYEDIVEGNFFKASDIPVSNSYNALKPRSPDELGQSGLSEGKILDFRNFIISGL
jgi:hypothetical protein